MATGEAKIEQTEAGAVVASPGWFVLNMADVAWTRDRAGRGGEWANPQPEAGEFEQYGIGIHVLHPGERNGLYHSESMQEDFLVLSGECLLLVEEDERPLKAWDFVPIARRALGDIFIGAGDVPATILMVGARGEGKTLHYPPSEVAASMEPPRRRRRLLARPTPIGPGTSSRCAPRGRSSREQAELFRSYHRRRRCSCCPTSGTSRARSSLPPPPEPGDRDHERRRCLVARSTTGRRGDSRATRCWSRCAASRPRSSSR